MGLDMYLRASQYVSGWRHDGGNEEGSQYNRMLDEFKLPHDICPGSPSITVNVTVAYWRKANQIHKWFVDNCQDGKDECQESYVERKKLTELRDLCKKLLDSPPEKFNTLAEELLPPEKGFFFGSTEIDEWYKEDLKQTVDQLTSILGNEKLKDFSFIYHASW